jgi:hypothetical protein
MATRRTSSNPTSTPPSTPPSTYKSAFDKECEKKFEEIEKRLAALEARSHTPCSSGTSDSGVGARLEELISFLKKGQNIPI